MKLKLFIDTNSQEDLLDASLLLNHYLNPGHKLTVDEAKKKTAAPVAAKKKTKVVEEEIEEEEEPNFDEDENEEETGEEEEENFEEEGEEEPEEEEEEKPVPKKNASKPAAKGATAPAKLKLEDVVTQCGLTHKKLKAKKLTTEKAQAKINAVIKKHGAKSTRTLDAKKYALVIKDLKALAA